MTKQANGHALSEIPMLRAGDSSQPAPSHTSLKRNAGKTSPAAVTSWSAMVVLLHAAPHRRSCSR